MIQKIISACLLTVTQERISIMYELVEVRKDDVLATSKIIADGTNNKHYAVRQIIQKYEKVFEETPELGKVPF